MDNSIVGHPERGLTVTDYAKREGISRQTAHYRIKKGKVRAVRIQLAGTKSIWFIEDETK